MLIKFENELKRLIAERAHVLSSSSSDEPAEGISDWLNAEKEILEELDSRSSERFKEGVI